MAGDAFGRAIRDRHRGEKTDRLVQRDGPETREHTVDRYLAEIGDEDVAWLDEYVDGPVLDMGAGAGRFALSFQDRHETVAIEASEALVETMRSRGVDDARRVDMFAVREAFDRDRFETVFSVGTQVGLAGSLPGLRAFLGDLAAVTTPEATAVFQLYDPE